MSEGASGAAPGRAVEVDLSKCDRCGACLRACPRGALVPAPNEACAKCIKYCLSMPVPCTPGTPVLCPTRCDGCGRCLAVCPSGAIGWQRGVEPGSPPPPIGM